MNQLGVLKITSAITVIVLQLSTFSMCEFAQEVPISLYNIGNDRVLHIRERNWLGSVIGTNSIENLRTSLNTTVFEPYVSDRAIYTFKSGHYDTCVQRYLDSVLEKICNINNPFQQWALESLGRGKYLIKLARSEFNPAYYTCLYTTLVSLNVGTCDEHNTEHQWMITPPFSPFFSRANN